jgi:hypothetical protein
VVFASDKERAILASQVNFAAVDQLLSLLPEMETWRGPFGCWPKPTPSSDGSIVMAAFDEDERLAKYRLAMEHRFWNVLDHPDYQRQETYNAIAAGADWSAANMDQVRFALFATVCVDRWVDGGLAELFEGNRVVPIVQRLEVLRRRY